MKRRITTLDFVRTIAALIIVIYHYIHFSIEHTYKFVYFDTEELPLFDYISFIYDYGDKSVQFFFVLSGFIFFYIYFEKIRNRRVSLRKFFIRRFSRLYPLHLLTLLGVAFLQKIYSFFFNYEQFIYSQQNFKHFILNLFLATNWGFFSEGFSYNGPVWSVSIEEFAYIVFFIFAVLSRYFLKNFKFVYTSLCFVISFVWLVSLTPPNSFYGLAQGISCFFIGGLMCQIYESKNTKINLFLFSLYIGIIYFYFEAFFLIYVIFPIFVLLFSYLDKYFNRYVSNLGVFNDLSYTLYLTHFPIQLTITIIDKKMGNIIDFTNPQFFFCYVLICLGASYIIFKYYEHPSKIFIRDRWDNVRVSK